MISFSRVVWSNVIEEFKVDKLLLMPATELPVGDLLKKKIGMKAMCLAPSPRAARFGLIQKTLDDKLVVLSSQRVL